MAICPQRALKIGDIDELRAEYGDVRDIQPLPDSAQTEPNVVIVAPSQRPRGHRRRLAHAVARAVARRRAIMEVLIREEGQRMLAEQARAARCSSPCWVVSSGVPDSELFDGLGQRTGFRRGSLRRGGGERAGAEDARSLERWLLGSVFGERLP